MTCLTWTVGCSRLFLLLRIKSSFAGERRLCPVFSFLPPTDLSKGTKGQPGSLAALPDPRVLVRVLVHLLH
jgi:hypothetical protein